MLRAVIAKGLLLASLSLALSGCADSITGDRNTPFKVLSRSYEKTLTPAQQEAAIAELKAEQAKQKQEAGQ